MLPAPKVIIHDIKDTEYWPKDVVDLLSQLSRPLPKYIESDEVRNRLSPGARQVYEEALLSSILALEDNAGEWLGRPVTDVIDTVLSIVQMAKAAESSCNPHQQWRTSWISLIAILGIAISEDVFISEDVPFLMPRTSSKSEISEVGELEGNAAVLLSAYLPRCTRVAKGTKLDEDRSVSYCNSSTSSTSEDSFVTLDIPFDAHVLPGHGKRVDCQFPVVCAADEDVIDALITSTVCQRHVWGISLPVVGVSLSKSSSTAKVVVGWIQVDDTTPPIHLAYAQENRGFHPSSGLFDLCNPASTLHCARFILGLHSYFSSIRQGLRHPQTKNFCWRLDHLSQDCCAGLSLPNKDGRLEAWVSGLSPAEISDHYKTSSDERNHIDIMTSRVSTTTADSSQRLQVPQISPAPSQNSNDGGSAKSYYSASEFANLTPKHDFKDMERGTDTWLWDRRTLRLHRIKIAGSDTELQSQINEMVDLYDKVTQFCWPKEWTDASYISECDPVYKGHRDRLFKDYTLYKTQHNAKVPEMEDDVGLSIINHLSVLFKALANAEASQYQAGISEASESAMRSAWDDILKVSCCSPEETLSKAFFVEKTIPFPKNRAVELGSLFLAEYQGLLLEDLAWKQLTEAKNSKLPTAVILAASAAYASALTNHSSIEGKGYALKGEERAYEPAGARVDGVACLDYFVRESRTSEKRANGNKSVGWMDSFFKLVSKFPTIKKKCKDSKETKDNRDTRKANSSVKKQGEEHSACIMAPCITTSLPTFSSPPVPETTFPKLYVPFIFAEYKRNTCSLEQAYHQIQMYCIFGVEFLASIGLTDFPVWGLVTAGTRGTIIMAWKSSKNESNDSTPQRKTGFNIIIDRFTCTFDLTEPLQVLQLMTCLYRIYKLRGDLKKRLNEIGVPSRLMDEKADFKGWMMPPKPRKKVEAP